MKMNRFGYSLNYGADFNQDLSKWKPYSLYSVIKAFDDCLAPIPYWAKFETQEQRVNAIENYLLSIELSASLKNENSQQKKIKL